MLRLVCGVCVYFAIFTNYLGAELDAVDKHARPAGLLDTVEVDSKHPADGARGYGLVDLACARLRQPEQQEILRHEGSVLVLGRLLP